MSFGLGTSIYVFVFVLIPLRIFKQLNYEKVTYRILTNTLAYSLLFSLSLSFYLSIYLSIYISIFPSSHQQAERELPSHLCPRFALQMHHKCIACTFHYKLYVCKTITDKIQEALEGFLSGWRGGTRFLLQIILIFLWHYRNIFFCIYMYNCIHLIYFGANLRPKQLNFIIFSIL